MITRMEQSERKPIFRFVLIALCALLFAGMVAFSTLLLRHMVSDKPTSEFAITEYSLSHAVKRDANGQLVTVPGNMTKEGMRRPCPT